MTETTQSSSWPTCPERLSDEQIQHYHEDGFLAFEGALTLDEVVAAREALTGIVRRYANNQELCDYTPPQTGSGGNQSGATYHARNSQCFFQLERGQEPEADLDRLDSQVRKFMNFENESELFQRLCSSHPRAFAPAAQLLGGEAVIYQSMALVKPAYHGGEKPWHQDNAYFSVENTNQVIGTWIALEDVDVENGCMHLLPGGHRSGPLRHHHTFDCEIMPGRIDKSRAVPVPLKAGGILFFHSNLPHQTPTNRSGRRRRALQFHYRRKDNPIIPHKDFDKIFAEADGTPASCDAARRNGF